MNVKSRLVGVAAAVVLSAGLTSGTLAETQTTSQVTLEDGGCSPSISSGTVNFGTYIYDAELDTYVPKNPDTDGKAQFVVSDTAGASTSDCAFQVSASSLTTDGNNSSITVSIAEAENIANSDRSDGVIADAVITISVTSGGNKTVNATLDAAFGSKNLDAVVYEGEITVSNTANSG